MIENDRRFTVYRVSDGESFTFDGAIEEQHARAAEVSVHPLERGGSVVDHVNELPARIAVRAILTESPRAITGNEITGAPRVRSAIRFLEACVGEVLVLGVTRTDAVYDALLVAYPFSIDNKRRVIFDLVFQVAQFAEATSVTIPALKPSPPVAVSSASEVDAGVQGCFGVRTDVDTDARPSAADPVTSADLDTVAGW